MNLARKEIMTMIFDIYEQKEQLQDIVGNRKVVRYHTTDKKKAFLFMNEKNKIANENIWRVAVQINNRLYLDIDNDDMENVKYIKTRYESMIKCRFTAIKTFNGYHLRSNRYSDALQWQYDTCRILYPLLQKSDMQKYIEALSKFHKEQTLLQKINGLDKNEFLEEMAKNFRNSPLFCGYGIFDIVFAINVILKGFYCIRISKKGIDDKPYMIRL